MMMMVQMTCSSQPRAPSLDPDAQPHARSHAEEIRGTRPPNGVRALNMSVLSARARALTNTLPRRMVCLRVLPVSVVCVLDR